MKVKFNKNFVAALAAIIVAALVAFGVKDTDKFKAILDAVVAVVPDEVPVPADNAGAGGEAPIVPVQADAGVAK